MTRVRRKSSHQFHSHIVFCSTFEIIFLCVLFASIFSHSHNLHKNMICCSSNSRSLLSFVFGERCECWNVDCLARCSFVSFYVLHSLHILLRGNVKGELDGFTKSRCQWWRTAQHRMNVIFRCAIFRLFLVHDRIRCHLPARRITTAINKSIKHTLATHSDVFDRLFLPNHVFVCFSFFFGERVTVAVLWLLTMWQSSSTLNGLLAYSNEPKLSATRQNLNLGDGGGERMGESTYDIRRL